MATKKTDFDHDLRTLMSAQNEEEVLSGLLKIIKVYSVNTYKDVVLNNPYFKLLIPEIKTVVISELNNLRISITTEINNIDGDLSQITDEKDPDLKIQIDRLKQLRQDCLQLIDVVDEKKSELENLL